jgi:hypothetical protein
VQVIWQRSPGNRRAVFPAAAKARRTPRLFASTYPHARVHPALLQSRRRFTVLITSSQPSSCCCTAHRPLSPDLSATADPALPDSLASPRSPACLTRLLALSPAQPLEVGSRKVLKYQNAWIGERSATVYMSTCGAVSFRLGRCSF